MPRKFHPKDVFCIEGNWDDRLNRNVTVRPVLELLAINAGVRFIYRDCSTKPEMVFLVDKWQQARYADYGILYLALHGRPGELVIDGAETMSMDELGELISFRRRQRIVYFGSCSVLRGDARPIKSFLERSGVKAVCGYTTDVDWMKSAALDLVAINELQKYSATRQGLAAAERSIRKSTRALSGRLGFRMVYL
ncbi:hypothetical protein K8I85_07110 [bacterium]|nr:hypothetical protein [bacterium]